MKKKIVSLALVVCLLAIAIVGGTMAYFSDTDEATNVMTVGGVTIRQDEWQRNEEGTALEAYKDETNAPLMPVVGTVANDTSKTFTVPGLNDSFYMPTGKNVKDKIVTVTNTGKSDAYVRTIILIESGTVNDKLSAQFSSAYENAAYGSHEIVADVAIGNATYDAWVFTYNKVLAKDETAHPTMMAVWLKSNCTNEDVAGLADGNVHCLSQGVQAAGFDTASDAFNTAFGAVSAAKIAEWYNAATTEG